MYTRTYTCVPPIGSSPLKPAYTVSLCQMELIYIIRVYSAMYVYIHVRKTRDQISSSLVDVHVRYKPLLLVYSFPLGTQN